MTYLEIPEFTKDLKRLKKRYPSIIEDLKVIQQIIEILPNERPPFSYRINNLGLEENIIKIKKIACRSLKGFGVQSGLRIIYAYLEQQAKIVFIEIYHKNEKEREDRQRIFQHFDP
jgi:mRNA-degrading endonuclease RelE of RelBE toxin-antitoxin system